MRIDLQKARDWADLILKVVSVIAILAGGSWAYYQFWITDSDVSNIQLTVSTEVLNYSGDSRLLLVHAKPKNIGKVRVTPGHDGLIISIKKISGDLKPGVVDLEKLPEFYPKVNVLKEFTDGYELEPGVEYDEIQAWVVPKGSTYVVSAVLDLGDHTEVDHSNVIQVE